MELKEGLAILIPTYNRRERLLNSLRSISSQILNPIYAMIGIFGLIGAEYNIKDKQSKK